MYFSFTSLCFIYSRICTDIWKTMNVTLLFASWHEGEMWIPACSFRFVVLD